jgi:hypothetical protein
MSTVEAIATTPGSKPVVVSSVYSTTTTVQLTDTELPSHVVERYSDRDDALKNLIDESEEAVGST